MFGKNKTEEANAAFREMNQFGQGTILNGDLSTEGDIRIDGKITGNIVSKAKVVIGPTGVVDGDIICQNAYIYGRVNGSMEVHELLLLSKTALVTGDVKIKKLVVEEGARLTGKCAMGMSALRGSENKPVARPKITQAV